MLNIMPDNAPRFYYGGEWFQMYDWVDISGGKLPKMEDRFYILFSNKELKQGAEWNVYSISVSNFGKSIILNEMHNIDSMQEDPYITDIISIYKNTPYLQGLNSKNVFFMSDVNDYNMLTRRILAIINGSAIVKPLHHYL
tara:strand:+ start:4300 stop:4719 length:420 start_codon:yes stop_codon:yes gene_type:complete